MVKPAPNLAMLNWVPLPAAAVADTVFRDLDDEHALEVWSQSGCSFYL
jgi:hypothetical protein